LAKRLADRPGGRLPRIGHMVGQDCLAEHSDGRRWRVSDGVDSVPLLQAGHPGQWVTLHHEAQSHLTIEEWAKPAWADAWGVDRYGLYADLMVHDVVQRMRYILPGHFCMGSPDGIGADDEHPQHDVLLTEGFWLADTPCTQALWTAVMGKNPSWFQSQPGAADHPVEKISWNDVQVFLQRLAKLLPAGCQPTLPTEAQWEYAARAGASTAYWWGDEPDDQRANWSQQQKGTTPVDRYPSSPWGLHDMHGNVWEWCLDYRGEYAAESVRDPVGNLESAFRAVRGGSWFLDPVNARSACRDWWPRGPRHRDRGFRLSLRSPSTGPEAGGPGQGGGTGGPATGAGRPGAGGALPRPQDAPRANQPKTARKKSR
jgi:formylglycine-generating enzyme required for sulfatase activity